MDMRMDGRCALITGGSKGIGFAAAANFLRAGADVAIVARRGDVLEEARAALAGEGKGRVVAIAADVSKAGDCARVFAEAEKALGRVDVLLNNVGIHAANPFETVTDEMWQADLDLKLFSNIRLARAALPGMKARKWGRIVNVLNSTAKAPRAGSAPSSVTRAAGMALTKVLANEGAPHNVLVNAVLVGLIQTDQWVRGHAAEGKGRSYDEYIGEMAKRVPLGRVGTAEEFANMILFLCSDAGSYVTGTAINVDGGMIPVV
ncbi:MAG: SDR family oxidoreductase [Alphaproteobacteria bacterium]|nr:SDR family oxidoreductase [Alphaproteobacteria bacterium]